MEEKDLVTTNCPKCGKNWYDTNAAHQCTPPETSSWEADYKEEVEERLGWLGAYDGEDIEGKIDGIIKSFISRVASSEYKRGLEDCMKMRLGQVEDFNK